LEEDVSEKKQNANEEKVDMHHPSIEKKTKTERYSGEVWQVREEKVTVVSLWGRSKGKDRRGEDKDGGEKGKKTAFYENAIKE